MYPLSLDGWGYAYGNPVNYVDPSGNIAEGHEARKADAFVAMLRGKYGIELEKDWGYRPASADPSTLPVGIMTGIIYAGCEWYPGRWSMKELRTIKHAVENLAIAMTSPAKFRTFLGPIRIKKSFFSQCWTVPNWGGCTEVGNENLIFRDRSTITEWTVVHELGHAWDRHYNWALSNVLVLFTGGHTGAKPKDCDTGNRLPGCNDYGYFYMGAPPAGSDANFNPKEDFAESVAAYVYPARAKQLVTAMLETTQRDDYANYGKVSGTLYYNKYSDTDRWAFINALIH